MQRLLIEGGGQTVSAFISAGHVDFLHYCIAPVLIGSGRLAIALPAIQTMQQALRLDPMIVPLGTDLLYVCSLPRHGGR
ncbi:MAG: hypothetical protein HC868_14655 [Sphingomonadales bacterium]|nr:hypothetical protein [Sphingomonadales bacterium]